MHNYVNTKSRIEIFNSKFTCHTTEWGIKYAHFRNVAAATNNYNGGIFTLDLEDRNIFIVDPVIFESFTNLRSISLRGHAPQN